MSEEKGIDKVAELRKNLQAFAVEKKFKPKEGFPLVFTREYGTKTQRRLAVINYRPSTEHPGSHHLGAVYVLMGDDPTPVYDNKEFPGELLEYIVRAQSEATLAGIKGVPLPGSIGTPKQEKPNVIKAEGGSCVIILIENGATTVTVLKPGDEYEFKR